jgi:hypothetical protein
MRLIDFGKNRSSVLWLALAGPMVLACLASLGCRPSSGYKTATAAGRVTIDGAAVPKGAINFSPLPGTIGAVVGTEIKAGKYRCQRVPLGKLNVTFIAQAAEPQEFIEKATGQIRYVPKNILPPQYDAGIPVEITVDRSDLNFDLKTHSAQPEAK